MQKPEHSNPSASERKKYVFFVEKAKFETEQSHLTVRQILVDFVRVDPATKTLSVKEQGGFRELTNLDESLDLGSALHFGLFDNSPTTVS